MANNKIEFRKQKIPFTQVANSVLNDKRLTPGAKGLYAYLYSKPDGWDFASKRIAEDMNCGQKGILTLISELKEHGYLMTQRLPTGRVEYMTIYPPEPHGPKGDEGAEPHSEKATQPERLSAQSGTVSNKELEAIKKDTSNNCAAVAAPFSYEEEIKKMQESERRELRLIAWFIKTKKIPLENSGQVNEVIKRHVRAAKSLSSFGRVRIERAADSADRDIGKKWTLETLYKLLTK